MARGPKKHIKKVATPKSWMLSKMAGIYANRPSQGPHKLRESIPLSIVLRNRLNYALNYREAMTILKDKDINVRINGRPRRDIGFPVGIMDNIEIVKTGEHFRVLYDVKGRFVLKSIKPEEGRKKLCKVVQKAIGQNKVPYIVTHDARTIRFPNPDVQLNDTIEYDLENNRIINFVKQEQGNTVYITGGNNIGRIGQIVHQEKHQGSFDIVHIRDANNHTFATRASNVFVIGRGKQLLISTPKDKGLYYTALEERKRKGSF